MAERRTLSRRTLIGAGIFGAVGIGAATAVGLGVANRGSAGGSTALQLSWLHSVQFGGSYIALDRGYWSEAGLDVSLLQGGPNAPVEPPVESGQALVGVSAVDFAAAAVAEGATFKIIGAAMQNNPTVIASLPDNPVNEPADLLGKRIGMALANVPALETLCTLNDIDVNEIEIVPTQYTAQPLTSGEVDCLLCWETDLPVAMEVQGVESVTMLMADFGFTLQSQTYIATEESLRDRRDEVVAMMAGEVRGWEEYRRDTDAAAALSVEMFPDAGLDLETQRLQAARQVPLMFSELTDEIGFGFWNDDVIASNIETLALLGQTVTPDLWDTSILEEVHGS